MKYLLLYLLLINAAGLVLMLADKIRARNGAWRISELTLMLTAALGGSVGVHMGMYLFRHKTRHPKFTLGVPAILTVQILLLWFCIFH
ncbi:MAG: DUF1294 domain-containing protein [Oscillospiraceae bacterium]|nr:DUF1294 domain-containing protein [Oscillospiraceae bacterium]